jgi:5-deoxy-glucuronate isomerase
VALCGAPATRSQHPRPYRHVTAAEVPVELRGAGLASREVRNMGLPDVLDADSLLVCEVITPAGNWSSWPPHKHDVERPGEETALEEIYWFETRSTDGRGSDAVGYQRGLRNLRSADRRARQRSAPATSSSCRTAGTGRLSRPLTRTCTT